VRRTEASGNVGNHTVRSTWSGRGRNPTVGSIDDDADGAGASLNRRAETNAHEGTASLSLSDSEPPDGVSVKARGIPRPRRTGQRPTSPRSIGPVSSRRGRRKSVALMCAARKRGDRGGLFLFGLTVRRKVGRKHVTGSSSLSTRVGRLAEATPTSERQPGIPRQAR